MDEAFVRDTIRLANAYLKNPGGLAAAAEGLGYVGMTAQQLLSRVNAVRGAATAGSQVATWVARHAGGGVLASAASELGAALGVGAAGGAAAGGAGAAAGGSAVTVGAVVAGVLGAIAIIAAGITGYQVLIANDEAEDAVETANRQDERVQERRDEVDGGAATLADEGYVVVQVTNHPQRALSVLGATAYREHEEGGAVLELCNFLHGGRCGGEEVDTPNGVVVAEASPTAALSVIGEAETSEEAWAQLCFQVENVRAAPLAEGFVADYGGETVTLDSRGFTAPC